MAAQGFVSCREEWWDFSFDMPQPEPFNVPIE
jgi:D-alanyl-D-alanine dipeptidase